MPPQCRGAARSGSFQSAAASRCESAGNFKNGLLSYFWHKDGKHLLILGYTSTKALDSSSIDWWVVATDGSTAVRTGTYDALVRAGLQPGINTRTPVPMVPEPRCWSASNEKVTFSVVGGDSYNLWDIELSPRTAKVVGHPRRLTTGGGSDVHASCSSDGSLAFAEVETRRDIWLLPFD